MYKYTILRKYVKDGFVVSEIVMQTKNEDEILQKHPKLNRIIHKAKKEFAKLIEKRKKEALNLPEYEKLRYIYSPAFLRMVAGKNLVLEIEYIPVDLMLKEIQKLTGKKVNLLPDQKIYITKQKNRIIFKQYDPVIKNHRSMFNVKYSEKLEMLLKQLQELINKGGKK